MNESNQTPRTSSLLCPSCGSAKVKRSRSRNFLERSLKLFNLKAYRCRDCNWRGLLRAQKRERKATSTKDTAR